MELGMDVQTGIRPPVDTATSTPWSTPPPCPRPIPGVVDVWRADLDAAGSNRLTDLLCAQERERAARIVRDPARTRWACSRGLLRTILGRYLECDPKELLFELGPHGKPALTDAAGGAHDELRFNLSHSDRLMLVAVSAGREVGVDGERMRERYSEELLRAWTMREAAVKCLGTGLGSTPAAYDADLNAALWTVELDAGPRAVAGLAVAGVEVCELRCWNTAPTLTP
jgi:phosphopantetheinyl transferase